jgi:hypothetical protein
LKATFICGFAEDIGMPFIDGLMVLNGSNENKIIILF